MTFGFVEDGLICGILLSWQTGAASNERPDATSPSSAITPSREISFLAMVLDSPCLDWLSSVCSSSFSPSTPPRGIDLLNGQLGAVMGHLAKGGFAPGQGRKLADLDNAGACGGGRLAGLVATGDQRDANQSSGDGKYISSHWDAKVENKSGGFNPESSQDRNVATNFMGARRPGHPVSIASRRRRNPLNARKSAREVRDDERRRRPFRPTYR